MDKEEQIKGTYLREGKRAGYTRIRQRINITGSRIISVGLKRERSNETTVNWVFIESNDQSRLRNKRPPAPNTENPVRNVTLKYRRKMYFPARAVSFPVNSLQIAHNKLTNQKRFYKPWS